MKLSDFLSIKTGIRISLIWNHAYRAHGAQQQLGEGNREKKEKTIDHNTEQMCCKCEIKCIQVHRTETDYIIRE